MKTITFNYLFTGNQSSPIGISVNPLHYSVSDSFSQANQLNCSIRTSREQALKPALPINHLANSCSGLLWTLCQRTYWLVGQHSKVSHGTRRQPNRETLEINFIADQQQLQCSCSSSRSRSWGPNVDLVCHLHVLVAPNCKSKLLLFAVGPLRCCFANCQHKTSADNTKNVDVIAGKWHICKLYGRITEKLLANDKSLSGKLETSFNGLSV